MQKNRIMGTIGVLELASRYQGKTLAEMVMDFYEIDKNLVGKANVDNLGVYGNDIDFGKGTFLEKQYYLAKCITFKKESGEEYVIYVNDFGICGNIYTSRGITSLDNDKSSAKIWRTNLYNFDKEFIIKEISQIVEDYKDNAFKTVIKNAEDEAKSFSL